MLKTTWALEEELKECRNPRDRLHRLVRQKELFRVHRGLYETEETVPMHLLAGSIYGPSYLSFETALSRYGLIPERVYVCTSATEGKNRQKKIETPYGTFLYRDVPKSVFPFYVTWHQEGNYAYSIASPEKALCDLLYIKPAVRSQRALLALLFDDLRIDKDSLKALDHNALFFLCKLYKASNLRLLETVFRRDFS